MDLQGRCRPATSLPVSSYDVIVCGAGPAGIGAAVSAARQGARTLLIDRLALPGGVHTHAGVTDWCESSGGPVFDEILTRMNELGGVRFNFNPSRMSPPGRPRLDTELFSAVALELLRGAGVDLRILTLVKEPLVDGDTVRGVVTVDKGGCHTFTSAVVIDATADADLLAGAGGRFHVGDERDGRLQHANYRVWLEGIDGERFEREKPDDDELIAMLRKAQADGRIVPPDHLFRPPAESFPYDPVSGALKLSNWEFEHIDPLDPHALHRMFMQSVTATLQFIRFARAHLPGFEQLRIRKLPQLPGVRESRRMIGQYTLTLDDVRASRKFEDGIARAWYRISLHDSPPGHTVAAQLRSQRPANGDWYEVPYRCLVPEKIRGLLVVGRALSAEREAHGSARVMATCMFTGSAAGLAAAMAASQARLPHEIDGREVKAALMSQPHDGTPAAMVALMEQLASPCG